MKSSLSKATLADLARSGLDKDDARRMRVREMTAREVRKYTKGAFDCTAYRIPYGADGEFSRLRFHEEQIDGKGHKRRYTQKAKSGVRVYMPTTYEFSVLREANEPTAITVTEGEKKAFAACKHGIPTVGLGGIYSYQSKQQHVKLLPELALLAEHITLEIAYDAAFEENYQVSHAAYQLAKRMTEAGTKKIVFVDLPKGEKLDDFLVRMAKEGQDPKAAYAALNRREYVIRDHCEAIRSDTQLPARKRLESLRDAILADLKLNWRGYRVQAGDAQLFYLFDRSSHRLYEFDRSDDSDLVARFTELYGVNGSEPEWRWLKNALQAHYRSNARKAMVHQLVTGRRGISNIYDGSSNLFRVSTKGVRLKHNGYKNNLFLHNEMDPVVPLGLALQVGKNQPWHSITDKEADKYQLREAMDFLLDTPVLRTPEGCTFFAPSQQRMLLECWIWMLFFPHLMPTRPILLLYGQAGSRKTSLLRAVKKMLFGMQADVSTFDPKNLDSIAVILMNDFLAALDNVDGDHPGIENLLATASTGGQHDSRLFYANGKKFSRRLQAFVAVTSRDPRPFHRSDLVDRLLLFPLGHKNKYTPELQIQQRTAKLRPKFWAYAMHMLPKLHNMLSVRRDSGRYRMADFASFALAIAPILGYSVDEMEDALRAHEAYKRKFRVSGSTLPGALLHALEAEEDGSIVDHTAQQLLEVLRSSVVNFPYKSADSLGNALRQKGQRKGLKDMGILLDARKNRSNQTIYSLSLLESAQKTSA